MQSLGLQSDMQCRPLLCSYRTIAHHLFNPKVGMASKRRASHPLQALAYTLIIALLVLQVLSVQAAASSDSMSPTGTSNLVARADKTRIATRTQYKCHWPDVIESTKTTPLVLVIGLSIGSLAGIIARIASQRPSHPADLLPTPDRRLYVLRSWTE